MPEFPQPSLWMASPFIALLAALALAPLFFGAWWGRHFGKVTLLLAAISLGYYLLVLQAPGRVMRTGMEYFSFIALIGSLFVISGGIHINVKGEATPEVNVLFLIVGALLANVLGTTGASMLLIRPWLRMNKYRLTAHHVIFFIFIVANVGGSLTPVGDPPLFLGYLKGVPFWWVLRNCAPMWLTGISILLVLFYFVDRRNFLRAPREVRERETHHEEWRFQGLANLGFLAVVLLAVFVNHPPFLREFMMLGAAAGSWFLTRKEVHQANDFSFGPIKEVGVIFAGIFATMMPAVDWLQAHAHLLGQPTAGLFFWGSGALSSVLDNAPTYLSFLSTEFGAFASADTTAALMDYLKAHGTGGHVAASGPYAGQIAEAVTFLRSQSSGAKDCLNLNSEQARMLLILANPLYVTCLKAISIGSVFFGANTYIGNGPNFMVKAIADQQKAHTPTFMGYIWRFTLPFMLPMLLVVWLLFFRG
jgi:Na+/H+ antiporter NhaD/arsenite permease-like protein